MENVIKVKETTLEVPQKKANQEKKEEAEVKTKGMSRAMLKNIAILTMVIDHVRITFCKNNPVLYIIFRFIGRICAPIMCFFIAQGYIHTSSKLKYAGNLLIFALISQVFFINFNGISAWEIKLNVLFTLFLSFLAIFIYDQVQDNILKIVYTALILVISYWCDWSFFAIAFTLVFYIFRDNKKRMFQMAMLVALCYVIYNWVTFAIGGYNIAMYIIPLGTLIAIFLLKTYNGKKGKDLFGSKYTYYAFYPAHMYIIKLIEALILI